MRPKAYAPQDLALRAMSQFWTHGYHATSIDNLVTATGVSRHGLYAEFDDKRGLFVAAMRAYFDTVVTPAFAPVEAQGAGFQQVRDYFEIQIARGEAAGLPGPGCLVANTMVEVGPHDEAFALLVATHLRRLTAGFRQVLVNEQRRLKPKASLDVDALAFGLTVSTQGLWSVSRTVDRADLLRAYATQLVDDLERKFIS
jgi:TetR/AcrR family transcriptional regulator, transcriptional repressor for nem operon